MFEDILDRLRGLHPVMIDLSLDRLQRLLRQLGDPHLHLPPVIHVAGTNGKGSTCAFLRAIAEADGKRVHVFTSPHLVKFNERIRLAGTLVDDATLLETLGEIEDVNAGQPITVFEIVAAIGFVLFARVPAELCVLEVGLGGRGDATNVIEAPAACVITSLSLDHREMLGDTIEAIAAEKAGIIKPGSPVVTGLQEPEALRVLQDTAGARLLVRDRDWTVTSTAGGFRFEDEAGALDLPPPALPGLHQLDNAGIAIAAMRAATAPSVPAIRQGLQAASWPGRLQLLTGHLAGMLPSGWELWLDGGHNPGAGMVLAGHLAGWSDRPIHLIVGMKQAKDTAEFLRPLLDHAATLWAVAEPGQHLALPIERIIAASGGLAREGGSVRQALAAVAEEAGPARVLICGSLYLAGEVLKLDR